MIQGIFLNYLIRGYWALWVLHCLKDVMRCESTVCTVAHQQCREKGAVYYSIPHGRSLVQRRPSPSMLPGGKDFPALKLYKWDLLGFGVLAF